MIRRSIPIALLSIALSACASNRADTAIARNSNALLKSMHEAGAFSGAAIIGRDGQVEYAGAFGSADRARAFTLDTAADGASLAKTVTAAAIWRLASDGALSLDDPVQAHVPEFPYGGVSITHLLSHTAGLPDYDPFQPVLKDGRPVGNLELQDVMRRQSRRPLSRPGAAFSYCNVCYDTLALLIERATGASYSDHAVKGLLGEAGARDAFLRPARFSDWRGARTLGFTSSRADAEVFDVFDNEGIYGGSNIYFTARDLHAWAVAWAERRVLPASVQDQALAPARIGAHASAITTTSWFCADDRQRCYYTGHHQGFFNFVYWDAAQRLTVVFVSNSTMPPPQQPWLMRALVALAEGRDPPSLPDTTAAKETEVDVALAAGRYRIAGIGTVSIGVTDGAPQVRVDQGPRYRVYQVGYGVLYTPGLDAYLSFAATEGAERRLIWNSVFRAGEGESLPN